MFCQGKAFPCLHLWARGFSALAGFLYTSAIVVHDRQPEYLLRAVPWFLISLGASTLDLALIFLSCVMQSKMRRVLGFSIEATETPDTQALLTFTEREQADRQEEAEEEKVSFLTCGGGWGEVCADTTAGLGPATLAVGPGPVTALSEPQDPFRLFELLTGQGESLRTPLYSYHHVSHLLRVLRFARHFADEETGSHGIV
uniref:Transmembrane protein 44 n=1 Tax=Vombatus ursinus TaxID=29139 RepID=A0A4X2LGN8_VOMUR